MRAPERKELVSRIGLAAVGLIAASAVAIGISNAAGPTTAPGVGSGAIATDAAGNLAVGSNSTRATTKLSVIASSTSASSYALQVFQPGDTSILYVRNDGAVSIPGSLTVGTFTANLPATNVSAGTFAANTGGGNFTFTNNLDVNGLAAGRSQIQMDISAVNPNLLLRASAPSGYYATVSFYTQTSAFQGAIFGYSGMWYDSPTNHLFRVNNIQKFIVNSAGVSGNNWGYDDANMRAYFGASSAQSAANYFGNLWSAAQPVAVFRGIASQSANLTEWQNSAGTRVFSISPTGVIMFSDGSTLSTAPTSTTAIAANNVSAGAFGANTGGGNYTFPANLSVSTTSTAYPFYVATTASGPAAYIRNSNAGNTDEGLIVDTRSAAGGQPGSTYAFLVKTGNTNRFGVDTAGNSKVLSGGFDVGGNITVSTNRITLLNSGNNALPEIRISNGTNADAFTIWNNGYWWIGTKTATGLNLGANNSLTQLQLANGGNVGVGVSPSYKFDVAGDINLTGALRASGAAGTAGSVLQTTGTGVQWVTTSSLGLSAPSTIAANNVSSGSFGANTGGGTYAFPSTITANGSLTVVGDGNGVRVGSGYGYLIKPSGTQVWLGSGGTLALQASSSIDMQAPTRFSSDYGSYMEFSGSGTTALRLQHLGGYLGGFVMQNAASKLLVRGAASQTANLTEWQNSAGTRLFSVSATGTIMFPDGSIQTTAATAATTMAANNISAGSFGANTGGGNYTFPASVSAFGGYITIGATDPGSNAWIRNNGDNLLVISTKGTGMYYGYSGGASLIHRFGSGGTAVMFNNDAPANSLTVQSNGRVDIGSGAQNDQLRIGDTAGSYYYKIGRDSVSSGDLYFDGTQSGLRGYTFLNSENFTIADDASVRVSVIAQGNNTLAGIQLSGRTTGNTDWYIDNRGGVDSPNDRLAFYGGGSEKVTFLTGGNVGVGDTNPGYKLSVAGDINLTGALRVSGSAGTNGFVLQTTGSGVQWVATSSLGISSGGGTISATNVSSGAFGANTGGGNYTFPANVTLNSGNGILTGKATHLHYTDNRTLAPSASIATAMSFGFGSYTNSNASPWADWILLRSYVDSSGGNDNALFFNKNALGMRLYQQTYGSASAFSTYKDVVLAENSPSANAILKYSGTGTSVSATNSIMSDNGTRVTLSGSNTSIGTHPTYGSSYSAFWREGGDYVVMTDGTNTYVNAPNGSTGTIYFRRGNTDLMTLSGTTLTVGGGTGKINVGTVDPIYVINGEKFATYMAGMIGVKEEVAGDLDIPCVNGRCERVIDFANEPKGSDFWLFGKTTDIRKHLPQASVILTPAFDGRVSYRKGDGVLTILATPYEKVDSVEVSYRFTAPRFDADQWKNTTDDPGSGFIIND